MKLSLSTKMGLSVMRTACNNEKGTALVIALMFLTILGLIGTTAYVITTTDMKIGSNYKASVQASNVAQAGINEALYRLGLFDDSGTVAPPTGSKIIINGLTNNNAAISIDPNNLLENSLDDDNDGTYNEIDELNSNPSQGVLSYDNRTWQTKIMLKTSDDADTTTTVYTPTIQPPPSPPYTWMEYSSDTVDGTELTIEFKKDNDDMDSDGDTDEIVFYDGSLSNPFNVDGSGGNPASGQPVVVITSTGRTSSGSVSKVQVRAVHQPLDIQAEAALMVNQLPNFGGTPVVSGFNYDGEVSKVDDCLGGGGCPDDLRFVGNVADNHGGPENIDDLPKPGVCAGCAGYPAGKHNYQDDDITWIDCADIDDTTCAVSDNEEENDAETEIPYQAKLESSGHKPGIWSTKTPADPTTGDVWGGDLAGTTAWKKDTGAPAWITLGQMLQVTPKELAAILASANVTEANMHGASGKLLVAPQGVMYINNAGGLELDIAAGTPSKDDGWGLMYVTGDLKISSALFQFKGLVYVEGKAKCSGAPLFVGCLVVKGNLPGAAFASGGPHILYSHDVLTKDVNKGMKYVILSWKDEGLS